MSHECFWDIGTQGYCAICSCGWGTGWMTNDQLVEWLAIDHMERNNKKEESMSEVKVLEMETNEVGKTQSDLTDNSFALFSNAKWETENLKPNTKYACVMVEIPDGYRLATDEDKDDDVVGVKYKSGLCTGNWCNIIDPTWYEGGIYAVPIETPQDVKVKELQQKLKDAEEQVRAVRKEMKGLK